MFNLILPYLLINTYLVILNNMTNFICQKTRIIQHIIISNKFLRPLKIKFLMIFNKTSMSFSNLFFLFTKISERKRDLRRKCSSLNIQVYYLYIYKIKRILLSTNIDSRNIQTSYIDFQNYKKFLKIFSKC